MYLKLLIGFGMLVFFTNLSYGISGHVFGLISSFLSNRRLRVVLDRKFSQEYPVNAAVLRVPFLVLHLSYYTSMVMLSAILLFMLMILLFTQNVIRHLICGNNESWLLTFNLIYETL